MPPRRALRRTLLLAAVASALAASPAAASSIVYVKDGNLWLTSPDGARRYQVTSDGGYSSPSQAADGTLGAIRDKRLVRLDRSGRLLDAPVSVVGSPGADTHVAGPYEARLSPDGTRFAYWFYVQSAYYDPYTNWNFVDTGSYSTVTASDHFTFTEFSKDITQAEWLTNDRLLGQDGMWLNMWTWKLGTGHGYTYDAEQFWFGLQDPPDQWGVPAYHWYDDPALSPDGSELAMTDDPDGDGVDSRLSLAATHGPAWIGEPPYENDLATGGSPLARPTIACQGDFGRVQNPSWSPDSRELAFGGADGVHVLDVPAGMPCGSVTDRLLVPGGSEPAFGPADVDMAQQPGRPAAGGGATGGGRPAAALAISRVRLTPRAFHRHARLRLTVNRAARLRLTAGGRRLRLRAHGGANAYRFAPRLRRGRYVLRIRASAAGATASARVRFRIR